MKGHLDGLSHAMGAVVRIPTTVWGDRKYSRSESLRLCLTSGNWTVDLDRPVFIIGSPRSGTSFLGRCCGEVSQLSYHHEPRATKYLAGPVYENRIGHKIAGVLYRTTYRLLLVLRCNADSRLVEKTPRNAFIWRFLSDQFPDSKFIHLIRDGRDVATSLLATGWLNSERKRVEPRFWVEPARRAEFNHVSEVRRCAWCWRRHVEAGLEAGEVVPEDQYIELRYERLVQNPTKVAERLVQFLGCSQREVEEFMQIGRSARSDRIGRWRNDETPVGEIRREAGGLLRQLGYD